MKAETTENTSSPLILVVDDDDDIRDILSYGIKASGCRCITADSGESALELLKVEAVEVVVSDVQMLGMSGLELCRMVKADYDADVIIITGLVNNFAYEEIIGEGASDFIEKPIRLAEIVARLKRVLHERQIRGKLKDTAKKLRSNVDRFQKAMEGFVQAISLAVEMRDPYRTGWPIWPVALPGGWGLPKIESTDCAWPVSSTTWARSPSPVKFYASREGSAALNMR